MTDNAFDCIMLAARSLWKLNLRDFVLNLHEQGLSKAICNALTSMTKR